MGVDWKRVDRGYVSPSLPWLTACFPVAVLAALSD